MMTVESIKKQVKYGNKEDFLNSSNVETALPTALNQNWRLTQLMTVLENYQGYTYVEGSKSSKSKLDQTKLVEESFKNNYKNEVLYKNTYITNPLIPVMDLKSSVLESKVKESYDSVNAKTEDKFGRKQSSKSKLDNYFVGAHNSVRFPINANFVAQWLSENIVSSKNYKLSILCDRVIKASKVLTGKVNTLDFSLVGIKIIISGRILGAEIATSKTFKAGQIPSNTIDILKQTGFALAKTRSGTIGIKVIYFWKGVKVS